MVERAVEADCRGALMALHADMVMLVSPGGRERTDDEYRAVFARAGLRLSNVAPLGDADGFNMPEGTPA